MWIKDLYFSNRFWGIGIALVFLFVVGFFVDIVYSIAQVSVLFFTIIVVFDYLFLFFQKKIVHSARELPSRFSNGDENQVLIKIKSASSVKIFVKIIDEIPFQFQERNFGILTHLESDEKRTFSYNLQPVKRGEYQFGWLNLLVWSQIGLVQRRFRFSGETMVKVYPSFIQMRKYELLAVSNRLTEVGVKRIRRISNNNEFEKIRDYVQGDDVRTLNWKATARRNALMVNQFQDEKSQEVYSLLDMGRAMKMPFGGMSLLDYSINAALVISNIAMYKQDKAGIVSFAQRINGVLPAERSPGHLTKILELLYRLETDFSEPDYEKLVIQINKSIHKRSLLILYTNFESLSSMQRNLKFFKILAKKHLVLVIFFRNTELHELLQLRPSSVEDVYQKTIAEKFEFEKKQIVRELNLHGVHTILTEPANLSINLINKYLQLKSMGLF